MAFATISKQTSTPGTPAAGFARLYFEGTALKYVDETGTVYTLATGISAEDVQDIVGAFFTNTSTITWNYNDAGNTMTADVIASGVNHNALANYIASQHVDHSAVSITAGAGLTGGGTIAASRTISMPNVGTAGTYGSASSVPVVTTDAQGRVSGVTPTAISVTSAAVSDFSEAVDDRVAALVVAGTGISATYNDPANTLTIASTVTQYTDEQAQDAAAGLIQNGTGISWTYNDASNTLTPAVTLAPFTTTNLSEGTNLYWTPARFDSAFAAKSTTNLAEGTNLYFTDERAQDAVALALTDSASVDFTYNDASNTITAAVLPAGVNHDALANFVANEHVDHSAVSISAGTGLTGGGDLTASRSLSIASTGVTAGTYGDSANIPVIVVNAQGQITSVSTVSASGTSWIESVSTADQATTSSATFTTISQLNFAVVAGRRYRLEYLIMFRTAATTTGIGFTMNTIDTAAGTFSLSVSMPQGADAANQTFGGTINAFGDTVVSPSVQTANANFIATIGGVFVASTSGTIALQFRSEVNGSQVTVASGSSGLRREWA
jgi:trimeric autotransporter adhesin